MQYRRRTIVFAPLLLLGTYFGSEASAASSSFSGVLTSAAFAFSTPSSSGEESHDSKMEDSRLDEKKNVINGASVNGASINGVATNGAGVNTSPSIAYQSMSIPVMNNQVQVPVAVWYPTTSINNKNPTSQKTYNDVSDEDDIKKSLIMDYPKLESIGTSSNNNHSITDKNSKDKVTYPYRISIKKIGNMLAGWDFIPEFASKDFTLDPTVQSNAVIDGLSMNIPIPKNGPLIVLAHGFLGSRYDLSHLAEQLAQKGFTCMSPEFPESLAASYPAMEGLDRGKIVDALLMVVKNDLKMTPSSYGIVGHSLGCGTVMTTGDDSWTRICLAGPPIRRDGVAVKGPTMVITSMNDGAVTMARMGSMIPTDFTRLEESSWSNQKLPTKAALILDRPDAPNHISFLTDSTNRAMIQFLSPLLPIAQALNIPVLDFDKYKESQDSKQTAAVVIPLVSSFLEQNMKI